MPVTINEVEINTTVTDTTNSNQQSGADNSKSEGAGKISTDEMDKIIEACMLRVRQLLDDLKER